MKCIRCEEEGGTFNNKIECLETFGEAWCDMCFENECEAQLDIDPRDSDHDKYGDPNND